MRADIKVWNPENPAQWNKTLAWTTVWLSTFSLTLGFCAWFLVPSLAPRLNEIGFHLDHRQLYWLGSHGRPFRWNFKNNLDLLAPDLRNKNSCNFFNSIAFDSIVLLGIRSHESGYSVLDSVALLIVQWNRRRNILGADGKYKLLFPEIRKRLCLGRPGRVV